MMPFLFLIGAVLVYFLWKLVINALGTMNTDAAKALVRIVGGLDVSGNVVLPEKKLRFRLVGIGLLGTFIVMFIPALMLIAVLYVVAVVAS